MKVFEDLITAIEEMINTTTSVMAPYPVDVVGRPAPFGKNKKSQKKSYGEKRAPHTEISEELKKQKKGSQKKAMLGYKYRKVWSDKNMDIQETMIEIADICEAILEGTSKATLYTGHREGDGSVEYKVKTGSDNGSTVTKVRANSPEEARKLVQKMYGGPDSAHQVLEAITDVCLSIIGEKE